MTETEEAVARVEGPVAWRWRYEHLRHWTVRQTPIESYPAQGHYSAVIAEPLYSETTVAALKATLSASQAEIERLRAFVRAYARKVQVGGLGMTDDEIATFELTWKAARRALEATDDQ